MDYNKELEDRLIDVESRLEKSLYSLEDYQYGSILMEFLLDYYLEQEGMYGKHVLEDEALRIEEIGDTAADLNKYLITSKRRSKKKNNTFNDFKERLIEHLRLTHKVLE